MASNLQDVKNEAQPGAIVKSEHIRIIADTITSSTASLSNASSISADTSNFDKNFSTTANTVQKVLDVIDDLDFVSMGGYAYTITASATGFNNNLSPSDNTVQKALDTLDNLIIPPPSSTAISTATSNFNNNLSSADNTVQKALDTIDDFFIPVSAYEIGLSTTGYGANLSATDDNIQEAITKLSNLVISGSDVVITSNFDKNLSATANTVQKALDTIDDIFIPDSATAIATSTANFGNKISITANTVQKALDTIDDFFIPVSAYEIGLSTTGYGANLSATDDNIQEAINKLSNLVISGSDVLITSNFDNNLSVTSNTVQKALDEIDDIFIPESATAISTATANFGNKISITANTVQKALDELDNLVIPSPLATAIATSTANFGNNLSASDNTVQKALDTLDDLILGAGSATGIATSTANFGNNISITADTVQKALDTLDDLILGGGDFVSLTDTPSTLSGNPNTLVQVNSSGDAIVFDNIVNFSEYDAQPSSLTSDDIHRGKVFVSETNISETNGITVDTALWVNFEADDSGDRMGRHTVTIGTGDGTISSYQSKFGTYAFNSVQVRDYPAQIEFRGNLTDFDYILNQNWSLDFWYKKDASATQGTSALFKTHHTDNSIYLQMGHNISPDELYLQIRNISGTIIATLTAPAPSSGWRHYAVQRKGTSIRMFINGVMSGSITYDLGSSNSGVSYLGVQFAREFNSDSQGLDEIRWQLSADYPDDGSNFTPNSLGYYTDPILIADELKYVDGNNDLVSLSKPDWSNIQNIPAGITANDGSATGISTSTANFGNNISITADTVQKALDTIDDLVLGAGSATGISTSTANFGNNISITADTVQKALDTLDDLILGAGSATGISTSTANFGNNISITADTVQKALDTIDDLVLGAGSATGISTSTANFGNNISITADTVQKALDTLDDLASIGGFYQSLTGDGSTTSFTVSTSGFSASSALVSINGLIQKPIEDYSISSSDLSFVIAPLSGDEVEIRSVGGGGGSSTVDALTENTTVNLDNTMTATEIQALIDAQPKNLSGYTLTFQFADGTYNLNAPLLFKFFYNGQLLIYGNAANNTVSTTKSVFLDFTNNGYVFIAEISAYIEVKYLKVRTSTTDNIPCIELVSCTRSYVYNNYVLSNSNVGVEGIRATSCAIEIASNVCGLSFRGISSFWGLVRSITNSDGGGADRPATGLFANSGIIAKYLTQPTGTSSNEGTFAGGVIR